MILVYEACSYGDYQFAYFNLIGTILILTFISLGKP